MRERFGVVEDRHVLLDELAAIGVAPEAVDVVVLSHLHFDHAGGALTAWQDGVAPSLVFPDAHWVVGTEAWARAVAPHARDRASFIPELPGLLEATGRLERVAGDTSEVLGEGFRFHRSEGHTPGLLLGEVAMPSGPVVFAADLIPGKPWVHVPITMGYDRYPERLIDEKSALLTDLVEPPRPPVLHPRSHDRRRHRGARRPGPLRHRRRSGRRPRAGALMMKSRWVAVCLVLVAACGGDDGPDRTPTTPLDSDGTHLRDDRGRIALLHGVNARIEGVFDVTFDDGRVPVEEVPPLTAEDCRRMRALGFDHLRLPINWSGIEPDPRRLRRGLPRARRRRRRLCRRRRPAGGRRPAPGRLLQGDRRGRRAAVGHRAAAHHVARGPARPIWAPAAPRRR